MIQISRRHINNINTSSSMYATEICTTCSYDIGVRESTQIGLLSDTSAVWGEQALYYTSAPIGVLSDTSAVWSGYTAHYLSAPIGVLSDTSAARGGISPHKRSAVWGERTPSLSLLPRAQETAQHARSAAQPYGCEAYMLRISAAVPSLGLSGGVGLGASTPHGAPSELVWGYTALRAESTSCGGTYLSLAYTLTNTREDTRAVWGYTALRAESTSCGGTYLSLAYTLTDTREDTRAVWGYTALRAESTSCGGTYLSLAYTLTNTREDTRPSLPS